MIGVVAGYKFNRHESVKNSDKLDASATIKNLKLASQFCTIW